MNKSTRGVPFVPHAASEQIVKPLAELLLTSGLSRDLSQELEQKFIYNLFRSRQNLEEVEEAVYQLLLNNPHLLPTEEVERLLQVEEDARGEAIFDQVMWNLSNT